MRPSVADRQYGYRFVHPPLHRTRRLQWGLVVTRAACDQPATTPREVLKRYSEITRPAPSVLGSCRLWWVTTTRTV